MADARYVIDLILRAHDASADAFQKIGGNFDELQDKMRETQKEQDKASREMQNSLRNFETEVHRTNREVNKSWEGNINTLKKAVKGLDEVDAANKKLAASHEALARVQSTADTDTIRRLEARKRAISDISKAEGELTKVLQQKQGLNRQEAQNEAASASALASKKTRYEELGRSIDRARQAQQEYVRSDDPNVRRASRQAIEDESKAWERLGQKQKEARQVRESMLSDADVSRHRRLNQDLIRDLQDYENAIQKAEKTRDSLTRGARGTEKIRLELELNEAQFAAAEARKAALAKNVDVKVNVDADTKKAIAQLKLLDREIDKTQRNARTFGGSLALITSSFKDSFANMEGSVARFDNVMRGAFTLLITFFLPQLIVLAGAAGGALLALGSSAIYAGGALAGAFVSGIGQAIPALGVFAAALVRVKSVMDAVQQANLLNQQQSYQGAQQTRQRANAENTLTNALEQQKQAHDNIADAQERVTEAREAAQRAVEDLILAEKRASLSVGEAEDALRDAIQSGQAGEIESRRLDLQEAQIRAQRARQDATQARRTGDPGGRIEDATKSLKDAEVAAGRAQRSVENARRSSEGAAAGVTAAAGKLEFLKSQMSESERALFQALVTLQNRFRAFAQTITAPLIQSFTRTTRGIIDLMADRRIINAARNLSRAMAKELDRTFDAFTSGRPLGQILTLTREASRNMAIFGRAARAAGRIFLDIAVAAAPAFRKLAEFIADGAEKFQAFTGSKAGQRALTEFFNDGIVHLKAWIGLLVSIVRLFAAIIGPGGGARTGLELVRDMTDSINEFADAINTKGSEANKFFTDLFTVTKLVGQALGPILRALGKELSSIFGEEAGSGGDAIKSFTTITTELLIPALGQFLRLMIRIGNAVGAFVAHNPAVARILTSFIAFAVTFGVMQKALTLLFGPLTSLIKTMGALRTAFGLGFRPLLIGGVIGLAIGAVILLLDKFGQLDDLWRGITTALRRLRTPINQLIDAFKELGDALGLSGEQGDDFLRVLARIIRIGLVAYFNILINVIEGFTDVIVGVIRITAGLVRVFRGFADLVIGFFTLDPKQMLKGFREIAEGLGGIFSGIGKIFEGVLETITAAFRSLPGILKDFGINAKDAFVDGMRGLPGALFKALSGIVKGPLALAGVLARLIDKALPDKISLPGFPDINLPDNPLKDVGAYALGGPVAGYGGGDRVAALLEPGEHVWTKEEVSSAGGHGIMFALRSLLGGGGQASGRRFAEGGQVRQGAAANAENIAALDLGDLLNIIDIAGNKIVESWRDMWRRVNNISREGRRDINNIFRSIANTIDNRLEDAAQSARRRAQQLKHNVLNHFEDMDRGIFRGLRYVTRNVNSALDAFGAKPTRISIDTPPSLGRATGGWIGQAGERGRDLIPTVLGRGEAVLNWGHQKIVNSALWNQYGTTLDGMFKRTAGYHAGGAGQGMAGGGFTGPGHSGEGFTPVWNMAKSKFGMTYFTGFDGHDMMTQSGNVSDHYRHMALDMGNGVLTRGEDALNSFIKGKLGPTVKQLIWRDKDQFNGAYIGGHQDHVHYAMQPQYAFNSNRMAKIISRAMRGLSIAQLLAGGSGAFDVEHLDKIKVKGDSSLARLTKGALDKLVKFGNKYIDKIANKLLPGVQGDVHYDGPLDQVFTDPATSISFEQAVSLARRAGFPQSVAELFGHIAQSESTLHPGVVNSIGATGLWQIYNHPDLVAKYGDMRNPWNNARAAFELWRAGGTGPWVSSQAGWGQFAATGGFAGGLPKFAEGGPIHGPAGQEVPILAHAGEWVMNAAQQTRLATLLGVTTDKLKQFIGFRGSPLLPRFQDGGEVAAAGFSSPAEQRQAARQGRFLFPPFPLRTFNEIRQAFERANRALRNAATRIKEDIEERTTRYLKTLQQITGENGLLDILSDRIERHTQTMATTLSRSQFRLTRNRRGRITGVVRRQADDVSDDEIAEQAIQNQLKTLNELNTYRRRVLKILNSIKRQEARLRARIRALRQGGVTDAEQKEIDRLGEQRQNLRAERVGLQDRLQEIKDAIAEQIEAIYEARTDQIRKLADEADRPVDIAQQFERVINAIGGATSGAISNRATAIQQQIGQLNEALAQAQKIGNQELVRDIQDQITEAQITLVETQQELIRQIADEAIQAAERRVNQAQLQVRLAEAMGQSTIAAQQGVIDTLRNQAEVIRQQIAAATAGGNVGLATELQDQLADMQVTIVEAQQQIMRDMAQRLLDQAQRGIDLTQIQLRIAQTLGLATSGIQSAIVNRIQDQIAATQQAIQLATNAGNTQFADDLTFQLQELQASLIEAQQTLIQAQIDEIQQAASQIATQTQRTLRIQQMLGQSTTAAQLAVIAAIEGQIAAAQAALQIATQGGNVGLQRSLQESIEEFQVALLEAQQTLFETAINEINESARRGQFQIDIRNRLADLMERGGDAIGAAQIREQILAAQRVNISALLTNLQTLLNQQLALPATQQNQTFILQLTEQVQELGTQLEENTAALDDAANATRESMIAAIQAPAQFQTGIFNQLNAILQSLANITSSSTSGQQGDLLEQVGNVLSTQGTALRQQLLNWLGINLLGLSGTEFVTAIAGLDWQTLTLGMSAAEKATFESLINAIIENQLQVQQNTEALQNLSDVFNPQDFTSVAWQWFRTAIFTGSGGLLPQFQPPGLQEGGTVLRTGMALVHEGEWFINPGAGTVPSGVGDNIQITVNEASGPLDVEHLVSRLDWERRGRRH